MGVIIAVIVVVGLFYLVKAAVKVNPNTDTASQQQKTKEIVVQTLDEEPDFIDGDFKTYIAGAYHHVSKDDIGAFIGVVSPDPENPYDKNAIAIYRNDAKLIGYIGKDEQGDYLEWSKGKPFTCVGYINQGDTGKIYGRVKILKPYSNEFVEEETKSYLNWALNKFGEGFVPQKLMDMYNL